MEDTLEWWPEVRDLEEGNEKQDGLQDMTMTMKRATGGTSSAGAV